MAPKERDRGEGVREDVFERLGRLGCVAVAIVTVLVGHPLFGLLR